MEKSFEVLTTPAFEEYISNLRDPIGKVKIISRLKKLESGNWGDASPVGSGVTELRIHFGPGYRIYCKTIGKTVVLILGAGSKHQQQSDIKKAIEAAESM
ncbi:type II toxin-antitoxin system RelE/ParE family toxin [Delftia sp. PS-11]|uniref:type II toxin-antitoxin system RelE/ParE family toxin n=1 Tax=Delftia sp. PS-11 TaxID=2767222 RepID=UPI0024589460|nr:type II toxin-antitoxin system RelE/ParE family toxin [Delftia sp. PS-11]KAJ8741814.1 type II toxin-antitoxin system RelE/ParE family toxin [Delftia sp. PS-11]